jgi:hypothetical protein
MHAEPTVASTGSVSHDPRQKRRRLCIKVGRYLTLTTPGHATRLGESIVKSENTGCGVMAPLCWWWFVSSTVNTTLFSFCCRSRKAVKII